MANGGESVGGGPSVFASSSYADNLPVRANGVRELVLFRGRGVFCYGGVCVQFDGGLPFRCAYGEGRLVVVWMAQDGRSVAPVGCAVLGWNCIGLLGI